MVFGSPNNLESLLPEARVPASTSSMRLVQTSRSAYMHEPSRSLTTPIEPPQAMIGTGIMEASPRNL